MKRHMIKQTTGIAASLLLFAAIFLPLLVPIWTQAEAPEPIAYIEAQYDYVNSGTTKMTISNPATADFTDFSVTVRLTAQDGITELSSMPNITPWKVGSNKDNTSNIDISAATDLMFWIKTAKDLNLTMRLWVPSSNGYTNISQAITVKGADGWQSVKLKISSFSSNAAVLANMGYATIAVTNCADLAPEDEIDFGRMYFFDQDPGNFSTLIVQNEDPEPIEYIEAQYDYVNSGTTKMTISNPATADFTDFTVTARLTAQDGITELSSMPNITPWKVGSNKDNTSNIDISAATDLMFWIKTAKDLNITMRLWVPSSNGYTNISKAITVKGADNWQSVKLKISDFSTNAAVLANMGYATIAVTNCADLAPGDTIDFGRMYFFDQDPGDFSTLIGGGDGGDEEVPGVFVREFPANYGTWHTLGSAGLVTVSEIAADHVDAFEKAMNLKISNAGYYAESGGNIRFCIFNVSKTDKQPVDMSEAAGSGYLYVWVRSKTDVRFTIQAWNTSNWSNAVSPAIHVTGSSDWQLVGVKLTEMVSNNANWTWETVNTLDISPLVVNGKPDSSTFLAVGDSMDVGSFLYYDGPADTEALVKEHVTPAEDSGGEEDLKRIFISAPYKPWGNSAVDGAATINAALYDVGDNKNFIQGVTVKLLSDAYYTASDKKVNVVGLGTDGAVDIRAAVENGILRFWAKSRQDMAFRLSLFGYDGSSVYKSYAQSPVINLQGSEKWQEIRVPLREFTGAISEYSVNKLCTIMVEPDSTATAENGAFLNAGESFDLGQFEIWNKPLDTDVDPNGGTTEPAKTYPPALEDLPEADENEESRKVNTTNISDFWIDEWGLHAGDERIFKISLNAWDKTDEMYSLFTHYRALWITDEEAFYELDYAKQRSMLYFDAKAFDFTSYIRNGYVRFWIKVPKTMTLTFSLRNNGTISYAAANATRTIEPSETNNGFVEVQIPIREFYDDAVANGLKWDPVTISCFMISPEYGKTATAESFLAVGEELFVSSVEVWTKEPLEPEPYDPTRYFYCGSGSGIMLRDINEVMPLTTVLNAMHNTYEWEAFSAMLNKSYSKGAKLLDVMTIRTMSDTQYDRRYTEPYDTVELMIPLTEKLRTAGLKAAVITADGKFTALDARIEGDYLVLPTSDMGDFVFYTAEGEFDWTYDPGAIGPNAKPGPQTGQTVAGALWSFGCLILSGLVLYFTVIKGRKNAV